MTPDLAEQAPWPDDLTRPPTLEALMRHGAETDQGTESDAHTSPFGPLPGLPQQRDRDRADDSVRSERPPPPKRPSDPSGPRTAAAATASRAEGPRPHVSVDLLASPA